MTRGAAVAREASPLVLVIAVAFALLLPLVLPGPLLTAAITALLICLMAQSWNVAAGFAGQFSLGHSVFLGIGAYTTALLYTKAGISPWLGLLGGMLLAALLGAAIAAIVYRFGVKGIYFALATLGLAEISRSLTANWSFVGGPVGILYQMKHAPEEFLFLDRIWYYYIIVGLVVAVALITRVLQLSKFGYHLIALREDEEAAEASGVNLYTSKILAVALSGALTAIAGTFYAQFFLYITPDTIFSFEHQLAMIVGTMVGGAGTVLGPIVGSLLFAALAEALRYLPFAGESREVVAASKIIYGCILIAVILYMPRGVMGLLLRRGAQ